MEGMTDEEFARMLQEQFDNEMAPAPVSDYDQDEALARQLQEELTGQTDTFAADKELAALLQKEEQEKNAYTPPPAPSTGSLYAPPPVAQHDAPPPLSCEESAFFAGSHWAQEHLKRNRSSAPSPEALARIQADIDGITHSPLPNIYVKIDEEDITHAHVVIIGPDETPYQGGLFHFDVRFPPDYPWNPPSVLIMTTDGWTCRFNPNLYAEGKVCLSILGTWSGPKWTPVQTLSSVLISIQSLMNKEPYKNEPGCENERGTDIQDYNDCIVHETIRVAVLGMLDAPTCPPAFFPVLLSGFLESYDYFIEVCQENITKDGTRMNDPFGDIRGCFKYRELLERLQALHAEISKIEALKSHVNLIRQTADQGEESDEDEDEDEDEEPSQQDDVLELLDNL